MLTWLEADHRKPLILRGARQVGKTWLVRALARKRGLALLEVNFERDPTMADAFRAADPMRVFNDLALLRDHRAAADSLLFLDEIQSAPEVLARLRWFAEEMPELSVEASPSRWRPSSFNSFPATSTEREAYSTGASFRTATVPGMGLSKIQESGGRDQEPEFDYQ